MPENDSDLREQRILVLAPTGKDGPLAASILRDASIAADVCADIGVLCEQLDQGAAALLITEEGLTPSGISSLIDRLHFQPPWSDVPVVLITSGGEESPRLRWVWDRLRTASGKITLLERPFRTMTLVSIVQSALRSRRRQYQVRSLLRQREADLQTIQESDRRKDQFLAMLGHELRNPLASIVSAVQTLIISDGRDRDAPELRRIIERQAQHMSSLINDLLEVSRISQGKIRLHNQRVDLADIVRKAVSDYRSLADNSHLAVIMKCCDEPLSITGDPTRLAQIVGNLLHNAVKFTNAGGQITVSAYRHNDLAVVEVQDTGIGMNRRTMDQMFEPFSQADDSVQRSRGGLGLGLALVKGLVDLHQGHIRATSPGPGQGSTFSVSFPMVAPLESPTSPQAPAQSNAQSLRVLIIDDRRDATFPVQKLLERGGNEVQVAADGYSGLQLAKEFNPALVLCDIGLPGDLDGYEVAKQFRADPALASAYLVAVTGYGQEADRRRALGAGFHRHITKPISYEQLNELTAFLCGPPAPPAIPPTR